MLLCYGNYQKFLSTEKKILFTCPAHIGYPFFFLSLHYLKKNCLVKKLKMLPVEEEKECQENDCWLQKQAKQEREKGVGRGRGGRGGCISSVLCHMGPFLLFCIFRLAKIEKNMAEMPAKIAAWRQEKIDLKEKERLRKERRANLANEWLKKQTEAADKKKGQRWRQWTLHWRKAFFFFFHLMLWALCAFSSSGKAGHAIIIIIFFLRVLLYEFAKLSSMVKKKKKKKKKRPSHKPYGVCKSSSNLTYSPVVM